MCILFGHRWKQGSSAAAGRQVRRRERATKVKGADTVLGEEKVDEKEEKERKEEVKEEEEEDEEEEDSGRESDDHREAETEAQEEGKEGEKEEKEEERKKEEQDEKVKVETVWQKMDICNCAFCGADQQKKCPVQWSENEGRRMRGVEDFQVEHNGKLQKVIQFSYWTHGL